MLRRTATALVVSLLTLAAATAATAQAMDDQYEYRDYPRGASSTRFVVETTPSVQFRTTARHQEVVTTLESPSGRVIDRDTDAADVEHQWSFPFEEYVIAQPEVGEWTLHFIAADGAAVDVSMLVEMYGAAEPKDSPVAVIQYEQDGALVTLDGSGSTDADGTIVDYTWYMGDGFTASGEHATHFYSEPGEYEIVLHITDDDGLSGWDSLEYFITIPDDPRHARDEPVEEVLVADDPAVPILLRSTSYSTLWVLAAGVFAVLLAVTGATLWYLRRRP